MAKGDPCLILIRTRVALAAMEAGRSIVKKQATEKDLYWLKPDFRQAIRHADKFRGAIAAPAFGNEVNPGI
jgi:hypothetical protein